VGETYCMVVTFLDIRIIYSIFCDYDKFVIILYNILKIAELDCCPIIMLSINICTIYAHIDTCLMSVSRFSLQNNVTYRLMKLFFYITDVAEWSRALDIRVNDWYCSVSMVWVQITSREEQKSAQKSNSNIVWFNFQTCVCVCACACACACACVCACVCVCVCVQKYTFRWL
jgi:hypothetical protein